MGNFEIGALFIILAGILVKRIIDQLLTSHANTTERLLFLLAFVSICWMVFQYLDIGQPHAAKPGDVGAVQTQATKNAKPDEQADSPKSAEEPSLCAGATLPYGVQESIQALSRCAMPFDKASGDKLREWFLEVYGNCPVAKSATHNARASHKSLVDAYKRRVDLKPEEREQCGRFSMQVITHFETARARIGL